MAGRISPRAQARLAVLKELDLAVLRAHGLVERFAAAKTDHETHAIALRRAFRKLKQDFTGAGLDALAQLAGGMEIAAARGTSPTTKTRILRDAIGSMRFQLESDISTILREEREKDEEKE